jgi:hypothetical protein
MLWNTHKQRASNKGFRSSFLHDVTFCSTMKGSCDRCKSYGSCISCSV